MTTSKPSSWRRMNILSIESKSSTDSSNRCLRRRKRRLAMWRTTALLLGIGILGTLFIDRLISFPLSLFAFIFLWIVIIATWGISRMMAIVERYAMRFALMWLLTRTALQRGVSRGIFNLVHSLPSQSGSETIHRSVYALKKRQLRDRLF